MRSSTPSAIAYRKARWPLALERAPVRGEWNYCLKPRTPAQVAAAEQAARTISRRQEIRARWAIIVEEQIQSGLNSAQFCEKRGLKYAAFILARRKLKGVQQPNVSKARRAALALIQGNAIMTE